MCPEIFTADHFPLARFEIFSSQKFPARKLVLSDLFCRESFQAVFFPARTLKNRKIFRLKVKKSQKSWRENWKKGCEFGN